MSGKSGRPTKSDQMNIEKTLRPYYEMGLSAYVVASKVGQNFKTVYKYFRTWDEEKRKFQNEEFQSRISDELKGILSSLDYQIFQGFRLQQEINEQIRKTDEENDRIPHLCMLENLMH